MKLHPNSPLYALLVEMIQLNILLQDGNYKDHGLVGIRLARAYLKLLLCSGPRWTLVSSSGYSTLSGKTRVER